MPLSQSVASRYLDTIESVEGIINAPNHRFSKHKMASVNSLESSNHPIITKEEQNTKIPVPQLQIIAPTTQTKESTTNYKMPSAAESPEARAG